MSPQTMLSLVFHDLMVQTAQRVVGLKILITTEKTRTRIKTEVLMETSQHQIKLARILAIELGKTSGKMLSKSSMT